MSSAARRREAEQIFSRKLCVSFEERAKHAFSISRLEYICSKMCSRGVTGFDGLYIERRATRCTPGPHLKLARHQTCQESFCRREVSVLRYEGLRVRLRGSL